MSMLLHRIIDKSPFIFSWVVCVLTPKKVQHTTQQKIWQGQVSLYLVSFTFSIICTISADRSHECVLTTKWAFSQYQTCTVEYSSSLAPFSTSYFHENQLQSSGIGGRHVSMQTFWEKLVYWNRFQFNRSSLLNSSDIDVRRLSSSSLSRRVTRLLPFQTPSSSKSESNQSKWTFSMHRKNWGSLNIW